ncbi:hypothetical protein UFOVP84_180 [uncultured Caudovirales phage]|uniref:Uncharacterized protein n=1 Tax=uncultured Caudovirales phage TaxID=2100421 RepID=A0A6J5KY78_9CAUD|nr:hypothetical protein UFOVP84_180 [uncultured Caudovirales phage]
MKTVAKTKFQKAAEFGGWVGMVLIQMSIVPVSISIIRGTAERVPPLDMTLMIWVGLFLFLIRSIANGDRLYIISNSVGFFFQTVLLILIAFK